MGEPVSVELPECGQTLPLIEAVLKSKGCPDGQVRFMAQQLDKRARQLVELKGRSYEESLAHLLSIVHQRDDH